MRIGPEIDDESGRLSIVMNDVDEGAFMIALRELDVEAASTRSGDAATLDVGKGVGAVELRFALAEQVEVRPVEDDDRGAHRASMPRRRKALLVTPGRDGKGAVPRPLCLPY